MKHSTISALLCLSLATSIAFAALSGAWHLSLVQIAELVSPFSETALSPQAKIVFWHIRLPRIITGLLIGAALSAAGTTYQGIFRNPLVSPDILGISAGAGLGASLAIWCGMPMWIIQLFAFSGGLFVVGGVLFITRASPRHDPVLTLVLVGIALGTVAGAGISLIKIIADPYTQLPSITFWLLGGLSTITPTDMLLCAPVIILATLPLLLLRWKMNLLTLSDDEATSLGINVKRLRLVLIVCATLVTAGAVSVAGIIGWIGLVVPHIGRLIIGSNHQRLLPVAMCLGATLLLITDTLARTLADAEIPLGILTAFIGAPFFLSLLLRRPG